MFGHQDDNHDDSHDEGSQQDATMTEVAPDQSAAATETSNNDQAASSDDGAHVDDTDDSKDSGDGDATDKPETPAAEGDDDWQHPGEPVDESPGQIADIIAPAGGSAQNATSPMPINARDLPDDNGNTPHELIDIKQKALSELTPLMGQLDLAPEDKFRTLLMIIQASDDQDMIKQAYEAAEAIKDEKVRAQALLDLVNEINYFTQHPAPEN